MVETIDFNDPEQVIVIQLDFAFNFTGFYAPAVKLLRMSCTLFPYVLVWAQR